MNPFAAVVLAGQRSRDDAVARAAGVPCKALAEVAGRAMVLRVLDALAASGRIDTCTLVGPVREQIDTCPELARRIESGTPHWVAPGSGPSASALTGLEALPGDRPVLLTTADHALLTGTLVRDFLDRARTSHAELVVAMVRRETVTARYPEAHRTRLRFSDGAFSGCNLYAFLTPAARNAPRFWQRLENDRKHPLRMLRHIGLSTLLRRLLGRLTLADTFTALSRRMGLVVAPLLLDEPDAAIDVDTVEDLALVERILGDRQTKTNSVT